jgi:AcrR family transcriptional regulator
MKTARKPGPANKPANKPGRAGARRANAATATTSKFDTKREAIIAAGSQILNTQGIKGTTLSSVAEAVGLITTSLTYYFKRKEDLAAACILRGIDRLEDLIATASQEQDAASRLTRFVTAYFELNARIRLQQEPPLCVFNDVRALDKTISDPLLKAHSHMFARLRAMLSDAPPLPKRPMDARALLFLVIVYWIPIWASHYDTEDYPRIARRMIDIVLNGLAKDGRAKWPPPAPLRFRDSGERDQKELFLIAATQLINEQGYHGASVQRISARLDVTKGSFYHHLDTKDDLVGLCFARTFSIMSAAQRTAMTLDEDGWTRLMATCSTLVDLQFSADGPLLEFSAFTALPPQMMVPTVQQSERIPHRFAEMISDGIADGSIRAVDPLIAAQIFTAAINSITELPTTVPGVSRDEALEIFVRPLAFGLLRT